MIYRYIAQYMHSGQKKKRFLTCYILEGTGRGEFSSCINSLCSNLQCKIFFSAKASLYEFFSTKNVWKVKAGFVFLGYSLSMNLFSPNFPSRDFFVLRPTPPTHNVSTAVCPYNTLTISESTYARSIQTTVVYLIIYYIILLYKI